MARRHKNGQSAGWVNSALPTPSKSARITVFEPRVLVWMLAIVAICAKIGLGAAPVASEKKRVIVMTDFYKDPDDKQSMIRFLTYANEFDVEGLIATSLAYGTGEVHPEWIKDLIDEYGKVLGNLRKHERPGFRYPSVSELKSVVKEGAHVVRKLKGRSKGFAVPYPKGARDSRTCSPALNWIGPGKDTPASDHIIHVVDKKDLRPVWVVIWGGPMDLAQALWRVRHDRTVTQTAEFVSKLRVYQVSWQDTGAVWIWQQFPNLFLIQTSVAMGGMDHEGDPASRNGAWLNKNVRHGHGALGAQYPQAGRTDGVKEGDSPSFLYLLAPGLSDPDHPQWGGWGGRFRPYGGGTNFYVDARDRRPDTSDAAAEKRWTVGRWNKQRNQDFAARMDWCVQSYGNANHNPVAHLNGDGSTNVLKTTAAPGQMVHLSADGSSDPDGNGLSYRWWQYREAGSYRGAINITGSHSKNAGFTAPSVDSPKTIHIILELTDNGRPPLTSYRRLIVTVDPAGWR
jgi:Cellulose-binding Sde182, nucleoside hydrolase-like domain/Cellulose-binding protein Sde0182, C-terminal domain